MPTSHLARAPRQAAVLASIAGLHAAVFVLIVAGLGPRLLAQKVPEPISVILPLPTPVPLEPAPRMPGPVAPAAAAIPMPPVEWPTFDKPVESVGPAADPLQGTSGRGPDLPATEHAPRLKWQDARLAALVESCYPGTSRRLGEEGRVTVRLDIDATGRVRAWNYVERSGLERLDAAVDCVVSRLEFHPGRRDGEAVPASVHLPIVFRLH
jgi:periplasmic protein TonB